MNWNNNIPSRQNVEISSEKENLDASRLVTFHFSEKIPLNIMGDAQNSVAYYVDGYFSMLDAPKWTDPFLMSISDHSPEFQKRRDEVMYRLMEIPGFTNEKMKSAHIWRGWILEIQTNDGERYKFNLLSAWNNAHKTLDEQKQIIERQNQEFAIQNKTQEEERKLQDIVAKQAFYGGSVVLEYSLGTTASVAGGIVITKAGSLAAKGAIYVAKSMFIADEDGSKKRFNFKKWFVGMAEDFKDSIGAILRKSGYDYDPVTRKPYSVAKRMITAVGKDLQNLNYEDYRETPEWAKMSKKEFENFKQKAIADQQKMLADYNSGKIGSKAVGLNIKRIIGEAALFFPFVASEYHNNQSAYSVLNAFATEWMFAAGAKLGSKIPAPGPWKVVSIVGTGLGAALVGNVALEKLDARRHIWLNTQKMNYRDERSALLHATSLGGTEILGGINMIWRKITGDKNYTFDLGIERTNITIPFLNKNIGTIPELNFYQNKVTLGTKPWEWLSASAFRGIEDWNAAVDRYKIEATEEIYEILGFYYNNKWIFWDNSKIRELGWKENLLKKELLELLLWENLSSDFFHKQAQDIVEVILAEATKNKPMSIPNSYINQIVSEQIGSMKIDRTLFVDDRRERMIALKAEIFAPIEHIPNLTPEQRNFLEKIPDRMLKNQDLYQNNSEKLIYEHLLKREDKITPQGASAISVGNYMADWLDKVVNWKHETKFLNDIKAWKSWKSEWTSF